MWNFGFQGVTFFFWEGSLLFNCRSTTGKCCFLLKYCQVFRKEWVGCVLLPVLCGTMHYNLQPCVRPCHPLEFWHRCAAVGGMSWGQAGVIKNRSWITLSWNIEQKWWGQGIITTLCSFSRTQLYEALPKLQSPFFGLQPFRIWNKDSFRGFGLLEKWPSAFYPGTESWLQGFSIEAAPGPSLSIIDLCPPFECQQQWPRFV